MARPLSSSERTFVRQLGAVRADGRGPREARSVVVRRSRDGTTGAAHCEVNLGETVVLGSVTGSVVAPFPDRPTEGMLKCTVNLSALGREDWDPTNARVKGKEAGNVGAVIEHAVLETRALDLESLCIIAGRKVWSISVQVSILNDAGNIIDAGTLAAFAALLHFRRCDVSVVGGVVTVHDVMDRAPVPLALHHSPLSFTFALFSPNSEETDGPDEENFYLVDPTDREELCKDGSITVIVNSHKEVCGIHKHGWPPLASEQLATLVRLATERSPLLAKTLTE